MATGPLIPLLDYQRIFRVIHTVLEGADARSETACLFFSAAGAFILKEFYKKAARPIAGAAFYKVNQATGDTIAYAEIRENEVHSSENAFHCWIECEGYIIDFMAPIFQESVRSRGHEWPVPRKMFQKKAIDMAPSPNELGKVGAFYLMPNILLTRNLMLHVIQNNMNGDLVNVCHSWFKKPPKEMPNTFSMGDNYGAIIDLKLTNKKVIGSW